jgi:GNAT superfamily N-acetyltransferase
VDWYDRLNEYFPEEEMKHPGQMRDLIEEKDAYHKKETEDYILMYGEFSSFIFVDYLLVSAHTRGKGTGSKVLRYLKQKGKTILLEVEPIDEHDENTCKRVRFYEKNGFIKADQIVYQRETDDGDVLDMDIFYWSQENISQEEVMKKMATACEEIHNFRSKKYYGRIKADPEEVLEMKKTRAAS